MTYKEKLLDPRWQKRRLEIFSRDNFTCQSCFHTDKTLAVHHKRYFSGRDPWDYPDWVLITLCSDCHEQETECREEAESRLLEACQIASLNVDEINSLADYIALLTWVRDRKERQTLFYKTFGKILDAVKDLKAVTWEELNG